LKDNDKLSKKDRETLFRKSEDYINEIIERYSVSSLNDTNHMSIDYLDPNFSDVENVETWNNFYDQYGMMFPEFLEKDSFLQKKKPRVEGMG
jgi:hypothetical protein